jgi:hypothetical protein
MNTIIFLFLWFIIGIIVVVVISKTIQLKNEEAILIIIFWPLYLYDNMTK